jgi:hypothetical protein
MAAPAAAIAVAPTDQIRSLPAGSHHCRLRKLPTGSNEHKCREQQTTDTMPVDDVMMQRRQRTRTPHTNAIAAGNGRSFSRQLFTEEVDGSSQLLLPAGSKQKTSANTVPETRKTMAQRTRRIATDTQDRNGHAGSQWTRRIAMDTQDRNGQIWPVAGVLVHSPSPTSIILPLSFPLHPPSHSFLQEYSTFQK